jgi:hypothetical protein
VVAQRVPVVGEALTSVARGLRVRRDMKETERKPDFEHERVIEQQEGITPERRGSAPAPSDRPENDPPHPQDVNEIAET